LPVRDRHVDAAITASETPLLQTIVLRGILPPGHLYSPVMRPPDQRPIPATSHKLQSSGGRHGQCKPATILQGDRNDIGKLSPDIVRRSTDSGHGRSPPIQTG